MTKTKDISDPETVEAGFIKKVLNKALSVKGFGFVAVVFAIGNLVSFISKFGISLATIAVGIIGSILLAVLYLVFTWATDTKTKHRSAPALVLVWSVTVTVAATLLLILVSSFINQPLPIRDYVIAKLGSDTARVVMVGEKIEKPIKKLAETNRDIRRIIVSETMTPTTVTSLNMADYLEKSRLGIGYHFIVDREGHIYPFTDVGKVASHTTGNSGDSIGIGLLHELGEAYPKKQLDGLDSLLVNLCHRLKLDPRQIYSKEQIDPRLKRDITAQIPEIRNRVRDSI